MKKLWLVIVLVALGGSAGKTFADVQNIRLSGDIRIRGYYIQGAGDNGLGEQDKSNTSFISQRTRVSVEADLEDHVLVVVTLKAESLWGTDNEAVHNESGAGFAGFNGQINRRWDLGVTEAYVQFNEMFYTAATLKLGRQYLNYGHGLILSSAEQEYNYDAARLVLDYYPLTIDAVVAELVNVQTFGPTASGEGGAQLVFVNARYEFTDSAIKNIEAYFGWVPQRSSSPIDSSRVPPTVGGDSPWIVGLRGDLQPVNNLAVWFEGAYEGTSDNAIDRKISAFLLNVGGRFSLKDTPWSPSFNANYILASGGGNDGSGQFRPWFDYVEGYNGFLFAPALSNIHIFNLGASVKPYENTTLSVQGYYYMKADGDSGADSNPNVDFGGIGVSPAAKSDLGWEIDSIVGYDYSKDVRLQLVYAAFIPSGAYRAAGFTATAQEVRGEVNVKF